MKIISKEYKPIDFPPLSDGQKQEIEALKSMKDDDIDTVDIPECDFIDGSFFYSKSLKIAKSRIYTCIDNDNLEWLKKAGKGYQARLNNVIRWARLNDCPITQM